MKEWREWYKQTVSHNTVVSGETSLFPCTGRLNGFHISPRAKIMDASAATDPYSNQTDQDIYGHPLPALRRTVALLDESFVVDVFRVRSGRSCDWVYRNTGLLQTGQEMGGREAPLGNDNGYQHIRNVKSGRASGENWRAIWTQDDQGMCLTAVGAEDWEYFTGTGTANGSTRRCPWCWCAPEAEIRFSRRCWNRSSTNHPLSGRGNSP